MPTIANRINCLPGPGGWLLNELDRENSIVHGYVRVDTSVSEPLLEHTVRGRLSERVAAEEVEDVPLVLGEAVVATHAVGDFAPELGDLAHRAVDLDVEGVELQLGLVVAVIAVGVGDV